AEGVHMASTSSGLRLWGTIPSDLAAAIAVMSAFGLSSQAVCAAGGASRDAYTAGTAASEAGDPEAAASDSAAGKQLAEIVVTGRRRTESLESVPVAVTLLDQAHFEASGTYRPEELQTSVPGLAVAAAISDRDNVVFTIRGQGQTYGTLFPSV